MDTTLLIIFAAVFLLCYLYLNKSRNLPPGPLTLPFLGSIGFVAQLRRTHNDKFLMEQSKKYGPIINTKTVTTRTMYLLGFDVIHQAFVKQADVFSDRPHWLPAIKQVMPQPRGIIFQSGERWKLMRRFTIQTLRDFGVGKTSLEDKIMQEVEDMSEIFSQGEPTDTRHLLSMAIANVIYGINFGSRFEYTDSGLHELLENMDLVFSGNGFNLNNPMTYLPDIIKSNMPKTAALSKRIGAFFWIKDHISSQIKKHKEDYDPGNVRDFVDLYIQTTKEEVDNDNPVFNDQDMFRVIMDLFVAGSETTFNTLNWSILYMIEYPEVQARCQREMEEAFGQRQISWSDRNKLPYVEATLLEVQRISSIVPLSVVHTTNVDTKLMGYDVPKGTVLFAVLTSSNMDPKYWDEPEKFRPERFISDTGKIVRHAAFMPFSVGPRTCAGESLAKMELFLVFANLLQRFTFRKEHPNVAFDFTPKLGQVTNAAQDFKVIAKSRM